MKIPTFPGFHTIKIRWIFHGQAVSLQGGFHALRKPVIWDGKSLLPPTRCTAPIPLPPANRDVVGKFLGRLL